MLRDQPEPENCPGALIPLSRRVHPCGVLRKLQSALKHNHPSCSPFSAPCHTEYLFVTRSFFLFKHLLHSLAGRAVPEAHTAAILCGVGADLIVTADHLWGREAAGDRHGRGHHTSLLLFPFALDEIWAGDRYRDKWGEPEEETQRPLIVKEPPG